MTEPDRGSPVAPRPPVLTDDLVLEAMDAIEREAAQWAASGKSPYEVDANGVPVRDYNKQLVYTPEGAALLDKLELYGELKKMRPETLSPSTAAQVASANRAQDLSFLTGEKNRQHEAEQGALNRAQQKQRDEETIRANNLKTTLDLLEQDVKRGELDASEATNRITAATQAANVQRNVLSDFGKYNLPAGTTHFPTGPLAALAQSMGLPAPDFPTMGTFGLNPQALGDSITGAVGQSAIPGVDSALQNAAAMLAKLGIPMTPNGRAMRAPSQGVS